MADGGASSSASIALITGGTRGIGFGIAQAFAAQGWNLVLTHNKNTDRANEAKSQLENEFKVVVRYVTSGDMTNMDAIESGFDAAFKIAEEMPGNLRAFVHNTAANLSCGIEGTPLCDNADLELVEKFHTIYTKGFLKGLNHAVGQMKKHGLGGAIVGISSPGCNNTQRVQLTYDYPGIGKSGMEFIARQSAKRLMKDNIRVNIVIPGFTKTEAWAPFEKKMGSAMVEKMVENSTSGRWAAPIEVGKVVQFLCSDSAGLITGVALPVDGGLHQSIAGTAMTNHLS